MAQHGWCIPPTAYWSASSLGDAVGIVRNGTKWFKRADVSKKAATCGFVDFHMCRQHISSDYSLLPNKRAGGKKSDRRHVWDFMERGALSA